MQSLVALFKELFFNDDIVSAVSGTEVEPPFFDKDRKQRSQLYTSLGYFALIAGAIVISNILPEPPEEKEWDPPGLIFTMEPGPGGGGGGGDGTDDPLSLQQIAGEDEAEVAVQIEVPEDELLFDDPDIENIEADEEEEPEEEENEAPEIVAPVVARAPDAVDTLGGLEGDANLAANAGSGTGGGIGEGDGSGLGEGTGGGFGGGAYRMGSGIEPPQLVQQTNCEFTDEAVLKKIQGVVVLEVVILEEGRIGDARILKGLPAGLNAQAIQCARQWVFVPGKFRGTPVAVIGEIAVEFTLL